MGCWNVVHDAQKARKCNLLIWDDELGPSTRPFVTVSATPSNASIEQPRKESSKAVVEEVKQGMSNVETRSEKCNFAGNAGREERKNEDEIGATKEEI